MAGLTARDAAVTPGATVGINDRAGSVEKLPRNSVCVVFEDPAARSCAAYRGILTGEQLSSDPDSNVGAILNSQVTTHIPDSQPIPEVLKRLRHSNADTLPVFDHQGEFVGVVSQATIIEALLRRERQLLKKTREFRQTANDDKERRYEISRLLEQNSKAFRMLLAGLSRPAGLESYREALEALTLVANAGWAQLALCDEKGKVTERIRAAHPTTQTHPPNYLAEQYMQQVVTGNAIVNRPGNAAALADDSVLGSVRKRQPAFLGHPVTLDERRFGCVYLWDKLDVRGFLDDDEVLLSSVAKSISLMLAQAIDHKRRKRLEKELDLIARAARESGGAATVEAVAKVVRDLTEDYWDWDAFAICISRCHGRRFQAVLEVDRADGGTPPDGQTWSSAYDSNEPELAEGEESSTSPQVNRRIMSGEPILINRKDLDHVVLMQPFGDTDRPSSSLMYVPIRGGSHVVGLMTVQSYQRNRFKERDLALLQRLSDAVAPAFYRCLAERTSHAFYNLASRLSAASSPKDAAQVILNVADELIGWDSCSMYFFYSATDTYSRILLMDEVEGKRTDLTDFSGTGRPGGLACRTLTQGPTLILRPEARFDASQSEPFGDVNRPSASIMYVPLRVNDEVLGVMSVQSYELNAYDEDDLALLSALADQCSGAIDRLRV